MITNMTIIITMTAFESTRFNNAKTGDLNIENTGICFSPIIFDRVYKYIDDQIKKENLTFYKFDNYELYVNDTTDIYFKKDGWTLSKIIKDKGVVSLAKRKQDNDSILKKTNNIFYKILLLTEK